MGYTATPVNGVQIPDKNQNLNQGYFDTSQVGNQIEPFTVMRFATMTDLAAKLVGATLAPKNGMIAFVASDNAFYGYVNNAWHRIYPTEQQIYTGTAAPASTLGNVGDLYIQI